MSPESLQNPSDQPGRSIRTILVVEAEAPLRARVSEFLRDCGYAVVEASSGARAQDVLAKQHVDLLFSDIAMRSGASQTGTVPGGEPRLALEKWVRLHYPSVKILLTSRYPQMLEEMADLQDSIVTKPYNYIALWHRVERLFCVPGSPYTGWAPSVVASTATAGWR
jgi:CheY-like chemotaxis protein